MARGRECGEMFPRYEVLGETESSLDGMTAKWEDFDERAYEPWERKKQASLRELFTKIYIGILACSIALFGSALILLQSPSADTELSSAFTARSAAPQDTTPTTISSLAT